MFQQVIRGAKITMMLGALMALPVSVSGQQVSAGGTPPRPSHPDAAAVSSESRNTSGTRPSSQASTGPIVKKLSVDDAVQMALEQNLDLQVQRINPQVQEMNVATAQGYWKPNLTTQFGNGSQNIPVGNIYAASASTLTTDSVQWSAGAAQFLRTGGNYAVGFGGARQRTNNLYDNINPSLGSSLSFTFNQPLMRNFRINAAEQQLLISKKNREISDVQLREMVLTTTRNVKNAYWILSYYTASLGVQQQSLELARRSLAESEARVKAGTIAAIDVIQSQAEVAAREESVIRAQAYVAQTEDQFRALILDPQTPGFWDMTFQLTDTPAFQAQQIDLDAAVRKALANRTDLVQQRKALEENDVSIRYMRNQTLPSVDVQAKYSLMAQGGIVHNLEDPAAPPVDIAYPSVIRSLLSRDYPTWSFGLQVTYPLGRSAAEAGLAKARLQYQQAQTQLRSAELQVATEVRDAARSVTMNAKRVDTTRASRELQERKLEAEEKKFAAGMSTTFFVLQAQRDLSQAKNAELSAILDYTRSLVNFETVQQAPTLGSGGSILLGTTGGSGSGSGSGSGGSESESDRPATDYIDRPGL